MSISITMVNLKTAINNLTRNCLVTNVCSVPRPQRNPWYAQDLPKKKKNRSNIKFLRIFD